MEGLSNSKRHKYTGGT